MTKRKLMKIRKKALQIQELIKHQKLLLNPTIELLEQINYVLTLTQHLIDQNLREDK